MKKILIYYLLFTLLFELSFNSFSHAAFEKLEGLDYVVRKINDAPIEKQIAKRFDLYEIYFENRTDKTFSIPGYSVDLGVDYSTLDQIRAFLATKSSGKLAVFNIAAGAASIALGGIGRQAASTIRSVGGFRKKRSNLDDDRNILSPKNSYIIYPQDAFSLFIFVDKTLAQIPAIIRFICHDEEQNLNYIVINNNVQLEEYPIAKENKQTIATPNTEQYK